MALQLLRRACNLGPTVGAALKAGGRPQIWGASFPIIKEWEQKRTYAMRMETVEHGLIWRRPKYVPSWQPEKSGDLEQHIDPKETQPLLRVLPGENVLDQVDDVTRELLSLRFSNHKEFMKIRRHEIMRKVQRHQYDVGSMEVTIAMLTVRIRNLQRVTYKCKKNIVEKVRLQEMIDRRKKLLKHLRRMDYKRFEWLIEELNILYRPPPRYYRWIARKASIKKLVGLYGKELRERRLGEYREMLELQKEPFLKEKAEALRWIAETEASLGVPVSVTIPEETLDPAPQSGQ